jgi:hypothetical protein
MKFVWHMEFSKMLYWQNGLISRNIYIHLMITIKMSLNWWVTAMNSYSQHT